MNPLWPVRHELKALALGSKPTTGLRTQFGPSVNHNTFLNEESKRIDLHSGGSKVPASVLCLNVLFLACRDFLDSLESSAQNV